MAGLFPFDIFDLSDSATAATVEKTYAHWRAKGTDLWTGWCVPWAAELTHRWSFNGDYSDSVGGVDAVKCGTYVSLYDGKVHMGYGNCNWGTGYVDLGTNMLDTAAATLEIWARHDGVKRWSRIFDYGADTANNVFLSWTYGTTLSKNQLGSKVQGEERKADYTTPCEIGMDYYIAATFEQQGDGATLVKWQRRDAATVD